MKPFLSIIIPFYNSPSYASRLIASILRSKKSPHYEIIVVDDGSTLPFRVEKLELRIPKQTIAVVRLTKNVGPAIARNRGVDKAKGKFVLFLDGDVELFSDTLANIAKIYTDDPDIVALTGVWVKEQRSKAFFPNYKALRDWSYWINERDKSGYYYLFSTRIASIKRSVFQRLGGFNELYPAPLVEDIELTYRIARRYAIIFAPNVRVRHEFESFWPIAKKYFLRAYYWTKLYKSRKKFDPVATTWWEAVTTITAVGSIVAALFWVFSIIVLLALHYEFRSEESDLLSSTTFLVLNGVFLAPVILHIFLVRKFLAFLVSEKGIVFAMKGFFVGLVLYCFIFAGALAGRLRA